MSEDYSVNKELDFRYRYISPYERLFKAVNPVRDNKQVNFNAGCRTRERGSDNSA